MPTILSNQNNFLFARPKEAFSLIVNYDTVVLFSLSCTIPSLPSFPSSFYSSSPACLPNSMQYLSPDLPLIFLANLFLDILTHLHLSTVGLSSGSPFTFPKLFPVFSVFNSAYRLDFSHKRFSRIFSSQCFKHNRYLISKPLLLFLSLNLASHRISATSGYHFKSTPFLPSPSGQWVQWFSLSKHLGSWRKTWNPEMLIQQDWEVTQESAGSTSVPDDSNELDI